MRRTKKIISTYPHRKKKHNVVKCLNCSKFGHLYRDCRYPLASYGVLLFRYNHELEDIEYMMIRRRHSFGYVEFVRSCYDVNDIIYVKQLLSEMTKQEREKIKTYTFKELWVDLWQQRYTCYNQEYTTAYNVYNRMIDSPSYKSLNLPDSIWDEPEWGFPKGKRNIGENAIQCAIREMKEETGLVYNIGYKAVVQNNILPLHTTEMFQGTDRRIYKHMYYIYTHVPGVNFRLNKQNRMQMREVSDIRWMTFQQCIQHIRHYNIAKKKMLSGIHDKIKLYYQIIFKDHIKDITSTKTIHRSESYGKDTPLCKTTDSSVSTDNISTQEQVEEHNKSISKDKTS